MTVYTIVVTLLVAAVAVLTVPWSRRNPTDFSAPELGYAWRGPRGAVQGVLRVLADQGLARVRRGRVTRRDGRLPRGTDPLVRVVFETIATIDTVPSLLEVPSVEKAVTPVGERVAGARLRAGPARRALGSLVAFAAPVTALVALAHGVGDVVTGVVVSAVAVVVATWLLGLHGMTIAGARTLAASGSRPRRANGKLARLSHVSANLGWVYAVEFTTPDGDTSGGTDGSSGY